MPRSTKYAGFALTFQSPWNIGSAIVHDWHSEFSVSGTILMSAADAEATALDLADPMVQLCSPHTSLVGWSYYPAGSTTAASGGEYTPAEHPCQQNAYGAGTQAAQQLEVAALARCTVGKNSRGKNVYLRKWIHDVLAVSTDPNALLGLTNPAITLNKWDNGAGPHDVVPVSPSTGLQGAGWSLEVHLYTHQLRRGSKRKTTSQSSDAGPLSTLIQDAAALAKLAELAGAGVA